VTVWEIGFWVCLGIVIYVYLGYPLCVFVLARVLNRNVRKADIEPRVAVVISAYNEEREIRETVQNKLSQDYPADHLQVIVVSDGSADRTDEIVRVLAATNGRLKLLRQEPRQGKTQALNMAVRHISADIIVFADANSMYARDAIRALVRNFADPTVGYVTGRMAYTNPKGSGIGEGSGIYMSYENWLRDMETRLGSIVGVDGGIDAIRSDLYVPMSPDQLPDFVLPLSVVGNGSRVVYEPQAVVYEPSLSNATDEFRMRVRVSLRALWGLRDKRSLLNPLRYPLFAWQLLSHKLLRYAVFLPLVGALLFNALAASLHPLYAALLVLHLAAYALATLGHLFRRLPARASKLLAPYYFVVLNAACAVAFWKFLTGRKIVLWKPREGG
jgi:cellulose synthase/poly-beta-1,6-N-acetylglucosamine synthase-like glycosyltransferase